MNKTIATLPKEVTALVHHVELNRAGWWDKAVHRLVVATVWLSDNAPTADQIQSALQVQFHLSLGTGKLLTTLDGLETQGLLVQLPGSTYRIPDVKRREFEKEIEASEKVASDARDFFVRLANERCADIDSTLAWSTFESAFLAPLVREAGANMFRLIAGQQMNVDKDLVDRFLAHFSLEHRPRLRDVVASFLDPRKDEVRAHISRMLHASFCVEASGLPEGVVHKLVDKVGKQVRFRIFVDTNFLFSLLDLHENPSNVAARELQQLISHLKANPRIELYVTPKTIDEAKTAIMAAKSQLSGLPVGRNFTTAALHAGVSGMAERFLSERLHGGHALSAEEWFRPILDDFVPLARDKGIELFNEKLDAYSTRQDVVDDIVQIMEFEKALPEGRRKSYERVAHDMVLWHFVNDKRSAYIESPIDAQEWILTVDFRLIGFDERKQKKAGAKVPLCLHPSSLIQLLQFWVPRTKEFEEAVLGSLRLPFLFQEFDVEAERTTLKILKGLGRFEGRNSLSEQTITNVLLNDGLRSRLKAEQTDAEETALIRDALVEEAKARAEAEATKAQRLQDAIHEQEVRLNALQSVKRAQEREIDRLRALAADEKSTSARTMQSLEQQQGEVNTLKAQVADLRDQQQRRNSLIAYIGMLLGLLALSGCAAWSIGRIVPSVAAIAGAISIVAALVTFVLGHLLFEWWASNRLHVKQLWIFENVRKFRAWLWSFVLLGVVGGVVGGLYTNQIQKNLDKKEGVVGPTAPSNSAESKLNQP